MVATYTQAFYEEWEKVGELLPATRTGTTDLAARLDVSNYTRLAIIISTDGSDTLGVDMEQANALTAGTIKTIDAGAKDVDITAVAGSHIVSIRSEEFDTNPGIISVESFKWFNVECTAGGSMIFSVLILGLPKDQAAVDNWASVTP